MGCTELRESETGRERIKGREWARALWRSAWGLLCALAFVLPFEAPVCRLGPLELTSVELVLYATLAASGALLLQTLSVAALRAGALRASREPLTLAAALFTAALFLSAACATDRVRALKFALRSLSGVLLFFTTRSLAARSRSRSIVLLTLLAGAVLSSLSALAEILLPESERLWSLFRDRGFDAFGLPRASGVFGYPTIGAMYWEAALPLAVVLPVIVRRGTSPWRFLETLLAGIPLSLAILMSATRSSLMGGLVVVLGMIFVARAYGQLLLRSALLVTGTLLLCILFGAFSPGRALLGQRLRFWHDDTWFGAAYTPSQSEAHVDTGALVRTPLVLRNTGSLTWSSGGEKATRLGYHLYREDSGGEVLLAYDGGRTALPSDVPPEGSVFVVGLAYAPTEPGEYRIAWDVVAEGAAWFSDQGNPTSDVALTVRAAGSEPPAPERPAMPHEGVAPPPGRAALWRAAVRLFEAHPLVGIGPDAFRWRYGALLGVAPNGVAYRDTRIHANSLYFETLADMGVTGAVSLLALMVGLGHAASVHVRARDVPGLAAVMAGAAFFVHGLTDCFLEFTPSFGLFWLVLGLSVRRARGRERTPASRTARRGRWPPPPQGPHGLE